jgi:hypothetical protein
MRKLLAVASAAVLLQTASMAQAADIGFSINVGGPPIVVSQPPDFLYPPELGFGVAVGVPYDMFYLGGVYYVFRGGGWYRTTAYGGSWVKMRHRELPPELRRYKVAQIHSFRDREYRSYMRDRDHYRGQHFRPEGGRGEEHREMRDRGHDQRQDTREHRPHERGGEHRDEGHER